MPPAPPLPSRHAHLYVRECAFTCYYHPATILFPPQLKILYETLTCHQERIERAVSHPFYALLLPPKVSHLTAFLARDT